MPRGPNHRKDPRCCRDLYHRWDLEDLAHVIGWMREAERTNFTAAEVERAAKHVTGRWGRSRVRRVLRVGVEIGWLSLNGRRYEITGKAIATLPPFEVAISRAMSSEPAEPGETRDSVRSTLRRMLKRAIEAA